MKKPELLAPAGNFEALEAAVAAGADAVYLGGSNFGARAFAGNFDHEELRRALLFAHRHGVRIYVTVNTLFDDDETRELADELAFLNNVGADGIIVQDLGVIRLARKLIPEMPLHASTQMTVMNSPAARFARSAGMCRIVPARELSMKAWKSISAQGVETEAFIHGALCVCCSGQCLMSSLIGSRSGNRGRCAQPCRMAYRLTDGTGKEISTHGAYLLSPKDMNTLSLLPELFDAGIASFKIEGRMKRPEYVAVVTDAYRRAFDSWQRGQYAVPASDAARVEQIFNRGFTTAYLKGCPGKTMISLQRPDNRGVPIGKVVAIHGNRAAIALRKELHCGDGLEFLSGSRSSGTTVSSMTLNGRSVESAPAGSQPEIAVPPSVRQGAAVSRTLDSALMNDATRFLGERGKRPIAVDAQVTAAAGKPLEVTFIDEGGHRGRAATQFIAEVARSRPLDEATLRKQLGRLGGTDYALRNLDLRIQGALMVPVSEINEARRKAIAELDAVRIEAFAPVRPAVTKGRIIAVLEEDRKARKARKQGSDLAHPTVSVWVDTVEKVQAALDGGADWIIFGGDRFSSKDRSFKDYAEAIARTRAAGKKIALSTPRLVTEEQVDYENDFLADADAAKADMICIHNLGTWQLARERKLKTPLWADMSLNIANSQSLTFWAEQGAAGATLSVELNLAQIKSLARNSPLPLECLVQGRIEMMVSQYCVGGSFLGGIDTGRCAFGCREPLFLRDRTGASFPLAGDQFCRMHVLNSQDLCALDLAPQLLQCGIRLRIDARSYGSDQTRKVTALWHDASRGKAVANLPNTTRGHYQRGAF
ncbi:MAG: DUF3656 domain-containing U32 family peptidase [Pyramidobacter sp.]